MTEIATGVAGSKARAGFAAHAFDEAHDRGGAPRGPYEMLFQHLDVPALDDASGWMQADLDRRGVVFGGVDAHPFEVDSVPRILGAGEWEALEGGLIQRARALGEFLADAYGKRRIVSEGVMPAHVLETAEWFEPAMARAGAPPVRAHVMGPDLVRCPDGVFRVLEDNARAPSGLAYLLAAREAIAPLVLASGLRPRGLDRATDALLAALVAAAPEGAEPPTIVLLTDGPESDPYFEHRELAHRLELRMATVEQLSRDGDRLVVAGGDGMPRAEVDVIYRRVDDERLITGDGTLTGLGELMVEPLLAGRLACVNSPGSGIADDKAVHTYVDRMVGFYLGEEPLLESVPGYDLGDPDQLEEAPPRLGGLVVKPRSEFGGSGVLIGPLATESELRSAVALVTAQPERFVAQEPVPLSVHPTIVDGELQSRHVDLRPFVISSGEDICVVPGGLTRFARDEGEMVVNSGQGGGAKDTWILSPDWEAGV